MEEIVVFGY